MSPILLDRVHASDLPKHDFQIAIIDDSDTTKLIVNTLQAKFPSAEIADLRKHVQSKRNTVFFAVGPSALRALLARNTEGMAVAVFTSSQAYNAILGSMPEQRRTTVTAIYAEPSPADQIRLISLLYKTQIAAAALVSDKTAYLTPVIQQAARQQGIDITVAHVSVEDSLNRALNDVANRPVLLAVPDSTIYNAENMRNILITTYRHKQAVIGFSADMVRAGALASTYSSIDDIVAQANEAINDYDTSGHVPEPHFPKYFSVTVNDAVARSLNIVVDDSVRMFSRKPGGPP